MCWSLMNVSLFDIELAAFATGNLEDSDNNDNYRPLLYDLYFFSLWSC